MIEHIKLWLRSRLAQDWSQLLFIACACFATVIFVLLTLHALSASPIADDWTFFVSYRENSFIEFIQLSMHHTGRIVQWSIIYIGYFFFGMTAVKIMPVILLTTLSLLIGLLIHKFINPQGSLSLVKSLLMGLLIACVSVFCMPSMSDSFLWYDSAASYMSSLIFLVWGLYVVCDALSHKVTIVRLVCLVSILFLAQLASEPTSLWVIGALSLAIVVAVLMRNKKAIGVLAISLVTSLLGFATIYFSPGSIARRGDSPALELTESMADALSGYGIMFSEWGAWLLLAPALVMLVIWFMWQLEWRTRPLIAAVISIVIFLTTTYPVFLLSDISQDYLPYRVFTLPVFGTVVALSFMGVAISAGVIHRCNIGVHRAIFAATSLIVIGASCLGMIYLSSNNIEKLIMRDRVVKMRDSSVADQKNRGVDRYEVMRAPLLLRGNAEDFYYNDEPWNLNGRIWVLNTYLTYMGIDENLPHDRVVIIEPPDLYW